MTKKKSFLIHIDSLDILDDLTNEQCGQLFKAIKEHHYDQEIDLCPIVRIAFSPFKNQFVRDNEKYQNTCKRRAVAGSMGGKQKVANLANASKCKQDLANVADNKNKNDNKKDNDSDNKRLDQSAIERCFDRFWDSGIRKVNKKKAKSLFEKYIVKNCSKDKFPTMFDTTGILVGDIKQRLVSNQLGFSEMHPTTYLNGERWKDEIKTPVKKSAPAIYSAAHQMYEMPELSGTREELQQLGQHRIKQIK